MLKVNAGVCGRVRIVKQNSITGEVTHDSEFNNIWTDAGISRISTYASQVAYWPNRIYYGTGAWPEPHNSVTSLQSPVSYGSADFSGAGTVSVDGNLCTVEKTRSITVSARGVAWMLSELGISYNSATLDTYALVRDLNGDPDPLPVSAIEILTIYYTVQVQYPMTLPPQAVDVEGLPPTTATFNLRPEVTNSFTNSLSATPDRILYAYGNTSFGDYVGSSAVGNMNRWDAGILNRTTPYFGYNGNCASHLWTLDPPVTKNNTEIFELEIFWQFSNVTPVEIE